MSISRAKGLKYVEWEQSCSVRTDRHDKATVAFRSVANAPKNRLYFEGNNCYSQTHTGLSHRTALWAKCGIFTVKAGAV